MYCHKIFKRYCTFEKSVFEEKEKQVTNSEFKYVTAANTTLGAVFQWHAPGGEVGVTSPSPLTIFFIF